MKRNLAARILGGVSKTHIALSCLFLFAGVAFAQSGHPALAIQGQPKAQQQVQATVPALLLSDIHFEPFWDKAKAPQLAVAPVSEWKAILAAPSSPDRE